LIFEETDARKKAKISGALHHVENIGSQDGEIILGFFHERPEDFGLSGTLGSFTDAVLGHTFWSARSFVPMEELV
jgi:oxalate decarboxylase